MSTRFAFVGFRHPHIFDMYRRCQTHADIRVVACCEEDASAAKQLAETGEVQITHTDYTAMLASVECDVVAVGDCYGRRADILTMALEARKHVISDKPLCISLAELDRIEAIAAAQARVIGCMLDMRDLPVYLGLRKLLQVGEIGEVQAVSFDGQHPLLYGRRPMWYFEPGMHGGVFNDIAVHAVDFIPWATGHRIDAVVAARSWNATVTEYPQFQQCGQAMFRLENGAGVVCDVSYLTPDSFAYEMPLYWRFTFWGSQGVLEATANSQGITVYKNGETEPRVAPLPAGQPGAYLDSFLREISGQHDDLHLSSADVLTAARTALALQKVADDGQLCQFLDGA
ncbi:MAG: Gfo/Idh/MocA family oxidoreductase [Pirellulaceae bacterium]|jgi:predicted dehydrogenase|nr:Gfo/Idh/MocA family oxidoreductase [Pirellulaceae bacterium]MDP7305619.1 Gfo/Idh/MocA family oxidoreductase [Pirellulaceae bacterium]HJN11772.1 Gfo/Idh/MocA family oxidoreductase [Pirellulaceae bacterium]